MNGLARTLANTSTQIAKIDHHHSRHLTLSQEPVQNTILPDKIIDWIIGLNLVSTNTYFYGIVCLSVEKQLQTIDWSI